MMSHVKPKTKKSFSIMLRVVFLLNTTSATFYEHVNLRNQKNGKVIHEESSVASQMSCSHRCNTKNSNALVVFNQGLCQCVKKSNEEDLTSLSGLWLNKPIKDFWKRVLIFEKERQIVKGKYYTTLPKLTKQYKITFELKLTSYPAGNHAVVLQMKNEKYPRTPTFSLFKNGNGVIESCHMANVWYGYSCHRGKSKYPTGIWLSIKIHQLRQRDERFSFEVIVDDKVAIHKENVFAREIADVKVFVSGDQFEAQKGLIRNLYIDIES